MIGTNHALFLILLGFFAFSLLLWWRRSKLHRAFIGLNIFVGVAFILLLAHQAIWQLSGAGATGFFKFRRRYDQRPSTLEDITQKRGSLLDRDGNVLSEPDSDKRWGHMTPLGPAALQVLGYASREYGLSGLERVYEPRLCGFPETFDPTPEALLKRAQPQDVTLSLRSDLQKLAFDALAGRNGAVVALDPRTGEILALVSSPSCDESELAAAMKDNKRTPLFNRATQGLYAPGSTFKIFTAANALFVKKAGLYTCPPTGWSPNGYTKPIRDTHSGSTEAIGLREAFAQSSNIYFAKAGIQSGWAVAEAAAEKLGLSKGMTLAHCGERSYGTAAGRFPDLQFKPNRLAYLGFGQDELLLTPLHIAALTATIANHGVLMAPHLLKGKAESSKRIWPTAIADHVAELMRASVLEGTSRAVAIPGLEVCGKTGTAENGGRDHAWFTCFAPMKQPQIVVTVLVENGGFGAAVALPIAKRVLEAWQIKH